MGVFGPSTKLEKGLDAFSRRDWARARRLLIDARDETDADGEYHLGLLLWRGLGGPKDLAAAVVCFSRSAEAGHPAAQTAYGIALHAGVGGSRNDQAAYDLFRMAAANGDAEGMTRFAAMSDKDDAHRWLIRAAEMGHAPGMLQLSHTLMESDPIEALAWLYASVSISGDHACRKRAAALAREMTAKEIEAAQKAGRMYAKDIQRRVREGARA